MWRSAVASSALATPSRVWDPGRKGGRSCPRGGYCEVDGEEPCVAVIPRAGGHEGFAGLEGPAPGVRLEVAFWGLSRPVASLSAALQPEASGVVARLECRGRSRVKRSE